MHEILATGVILFLVMDPLGNIPIFLSLLFDPCNDGPGQLGRAQRST